MRICVVVKSDAVYRKVKQIFTEYDVMDNVSHFQDLVEVTRSEEFSIAIIDDSLHWRDRAIAFLNEFERPSVVFSGNFNDLEAKVRGGYSEGGSSSSKITAVNNEQTVSSAENETDKGKETNQVPSTTKDILSIRPGVPVTPIQPTVKPTVQPTEPKQEVIQQIKYIDRPVVKEVERIVEKVTEVQVEVEKFVDREVVRKQIVEIKPDFDAIDHDFELPSILPPPAVEESHKATIEKPALTNGPYFIGVMSAESDIDISSYVFQISTSLADLGHKPLVIGDGHEEISELEKSFFKNQNDDAEAEIFENEGVSYMRQDTPWDYSDILASEFTHVIFWYQDISHIGDNQYVDWTRTHYPLLLCSGAKWKTQSVKDIVSDFSEALLSRVQILTVKKNSEFVKEIEEICEGVTIEELPFAPDPFSPSKKAVKWTANLIHVQKNRSNNIRLFLILVITLIVCSFLIFVGLQIDIGG